MNRDEFVLGLLIGVGIGLAAGLLAAPTPGHDSRGWVLARGAAVRRRTAEYVRTHNIMDIVRQRGLRGLMGPAGDLPAEAASSPSDRAAT